MAGVNREWNRARFECHRQQYLCRGHFKSNLMPYAEITELIISFFLLYVTWTCLFLNIFLCNVCVYWSYRQHWLWRITATSTPLTPDLLPTAISPQQRNPYCCRGLFFSGVVLSLTLKYFKTDIFSFLFLRFELKKVRIITIKKFKFTLEPATKAQRRSRGVILLFL
jgi:hypothetical protein